MGGVGWGGPLCADLRAQAYIAAMSGWLAGWLALTLFALLILQRAPATTGFYRTVLELYSHSHSILNDPIFRHPGSHQIFACHNSMKDFPRNFKALPSVQRYRALSNANLRHDSGPPKRCGQSTILQLFFFKLSFAKRTLRENSLPKRKMLTVQNAAALWREHDFQAKKILKI